MLRQAFAVLPNALRLGLVALALWIVRGSGNAEGKVYLVDRPPHAADAPLLEHVVATPWRLGDGTEALIVRGRLRRRPGGDPNGPGPLVAPFRVALVDAHGGVGQKAAFGAWAPSTVLCQAQQAAGLFEAVHGAGATMQPMGDNLPFEAIIAPFVRTAESRWLVLDREHAVGQKQPSTPGAAPSMAPPA